MGPIISMSDDASSLPPAVRRVREDLTDSAASGRIAVHPGLHDLFPWLAHGITGPGHSGARGGGAGAAADFALTGDGPAQGAYRRWTSLLDEVGFGRAVLGRQVHGNVVRLHREGAAGLEIASSTDGHVTRTRGVLLAVTVADCVPVTVVDPGRRSIAVIHAGWRGTAAGVLEAGVEVLKERMGSRPGDLYVHLGPSICGSCYEVGPEVHEALGLRPVRGPTPVDLRAVLAERALAAGAAPDRVTVSEWCTLCGESPFFSHRRGDPWRQVSFAGLKVGA